MKTTMMVLFGMIATTAAKADGFICEGQKTGLVFKMYNHTQAVDGTRSGAIMIISDPAVAYGNKTIAIFSDAKNTLSSKNVVYTGKVDLRVIETSRKGENIAGTKLGELASIKAHIFFNYFSDTPSVEGDEVKGLVSYMKRNGEYTQERLACARYKKN
ncbi:MAG: hypothetical protein V9F03_02030 [Microthrixaceae bacterium]